MPNYLQLGEIDIAGKKCKYRVTGKAGSAEDGSPYLIDVGNIPGYYQLDMVEEHGDRVERLHHKYRLQAAHYVTFDYPQWDQPCIEIYTEFVANFIEALKEKLLPQSKMNLLILSAEMMSMVALNLVNIRPMWTDSDSPIQIRHILSFQGIVNHEGILPAAFIEKIFATNCKLPEYLDSANKIRDGKIPNRNELIRQVFSRLASALYQDDDKTPSIYHSVLKWVGVSPGIACYGLRMFGMVTSNHTAKLTLDMLNAFDVKTFSRCLETKFNGFDILSIIQTQPAFTKVPILCLSSDEDILAPPEYNANKLVALLPKTSALVVLHDKKLLKPIHNNLFNLILIAGITGKLSQNFLNHYDLSIAPTKLPLDYLFLANQLQGIHPLELNQEGIKTKETEPQRGIRP